MTDRVRVVVDAPGNIVIPSDQRLVVERDTTAQVVTEAPERVVVESGQAVVVRVGTGARGETGPAGPQGDPGPVELYDSATEPVGATFPYLRFERDLDGDVQRVFIGTAT